MVRWRQRRAARRRLSLARCQRYRTRRRGQGVRAARRARVLPLPGGPSWRARCPPTATTSTPCPPTCPRTPRDGAARATALTHAIAVVEDVEAERPTLTPLLTLSLASEPLTWGFSVHWRWPALVVYGPTADSLRTEERPASASGTGVPDEVGWPRRFFAITTLASLDAGGPAAADGRTADGPGRCRDRLTPISRAAGDRPARPRC